MVVDEMMRAKHTMKAIGKELGRSENAVRNAFRNIIYHQLLTNDPAKIAKKYHMALHELHDDIVHPKYALPVHKPVPWTALTTMMLIGCAYYTHLVYKNWVMLG